MYDWSNQIDWAMISLLRRKIQISGCLIQNQVIYQTVNANKDSDLQIHCKYGYGCQILANCM